MTAEPDDNASANEAAALLLRLSITGAGPTLDKAEALIADEPRAPLFRELIRTEVGGSMALERLASAYSRQLVTVVEATPGMENKGSHVFHGMANLFIGGILAFVDDMPTKMKTDFLTTFAEGLNAGLMLRARSKAAEAKRPKH